MLTHEIPIVWAPLSGSALSWVELRLNADAGVWHRMVAGSGGFIFLRSRRGANPIAILKACLPQKSFPSRQDDILWQASVTLPGKEWRRRSWMLDAGCWRRAVAPSTFCGFRAAAKPAAKKAGSWQEASGFWGAGRSGPWQRHVQGHRCRRILQCVTRLEFAACVCVFLFFYPFCVGYGFLLILLFGCSARKCQFTPKNMYTHSTPIQQHTQYTQYTQYTPHTRPTSCVWTYILPIRRVWEYSRLRTHIMAYLFLAVFAQIGQGCQAKCVEEY